MRIRMDDESWETDVASIGEAITAAAARAERQGRIVVEVSVDGTAWNENQLGTAELTAGSAKEICLLTANLDALVCHTLEDASAALVDADDLQREAAELLQTGRRAEALEKLGDALGIWQSVQEAVTKSTQACGLDMTTLTVGGAPFMEHVGRLSEHLSTLGATVKSDDPVELSDTLLYDLPDVVADWRELLDVMRTTIVDRPAKAGATGGTP